MTAARRSPQSAYALVVAYTRDGDDGQAARVYVESRMSLAAYQRAVAEGRKQRGSR